MASVFKRGGDESRKGKWYAAWIDETGKQKTKSTGTTDKATAKRIAAKFEAEAAERRNGTIDVAKERSAAHSRRPIAEHVADFIAVLAARQNTDKHVSLVTTHLDKLVLLANLESIADLTGSAIQRAIGRLRDGGASLRTCNAYLRSAKSFSRWLRTEKRASDDPLESLAAFNDSTDRRHVRRELTAEELAYLLRFVETHTTDNHNLPGPDRAMVYRLALGTGFRAKEIRSLTPKSFALSGDNPAVTLEARSSKRRRIDCQPIHAGLAALLKPWLAKRPKDQLLFATLPGDTARMIRADLASARAAWIDEAKDDAKEQKRRQESDFLAYRNAAGEVADFHATRHTFISGIVNGGASVKVAQELARHSTPTLTIGRYAHTRVGDLRQAIATLPQPGGAVHAQYSRCDLGQNDAADCDTLRKSEAESVAQGSPQTPPQCDFMQDVAARVGKEALVGVEPTMADLQSAALATWLQRLMYLPAYGTDLNGQVELARPQTAASCAECSNRNEVYRRTGWSGFNRASGWPQSFPKLPRPCARPGG